MAKIAKQHCIQPDADNLNFIGSGVPRVFTEENINQLVREVIGHPYFTRLEHVMQMMPRIPIDILPAGVYTHDLGELAKKVVRLNAAGTDTGKQEKIFNEIANLLKRPAEVNNRFIHSLEVMAVGKAISKRLGLPPFSRDVIALTCLLHDIGHCPFGHEGEHATKERLGSRHLSPDLIDHNRNGLVKAAKIGIPQAVAYGLLYHDGLPLESEKVRRKYNVQNLPQPYGSLAYTPSSWPALEYQIAAVADDISNTARDLVAVLKMSRNQDGPGLSFVELCEQSPLFAAEAKKWFCNKFPKKAAKITKTFESNKGTNYDEILEELLPELEALFSDRNEPSVYRLTCRIVKHVRDALISDVCEQVKRNVKQDPIKQPIVGFSPEVETNMGTLQHLVVEARDQLKEREEIKNLVKYLFDQAMDNPENASFPKGLASKLQAAKKGEQRAQAFIDYYVELTDIEAFKLYNNLMKTNGKSIGRNPLHFVEIVLSSLGERHVGK